MSNTPYYWWLPIVAVLLLTPFTPAIDLACARYFYDSSAAQFSQSAAFKFSFDYLTLPAMFSFIGASLVALSGAIFKRHRHLLQVSLLILLTYALGSGLGGECHL